MEELFFVWFGIMVLAVIAWVLMEGPGPERINNWQDDLDDEG